MGQSRPGKIQTITGSCPICTGPTEFSYRPFCSRHCADADLSRWLRGGYAIPVLADEDEDGDNASAAGNAEIPRSAITFETDD